MSRSPFDAVLLTGQLTLAIENPRAVSYGDDEKVRQAAMTREPIIATNLDKGSYYLTYHRWARKGPFVDRLAFYRIEVNCLDEAGEHPKWFTYAQQLRAELQRRCPSAWTRALARSCRRSCSMR